MMNTDGSLDIVFILEMNMTAEHFKQSMKRVKSFEPEMIVADCRIQDTSDCQTTSEDRIEPLFPYKRPMTKEGFLRNMNMFMMNTMIVTSVQKIRF